MSHFIVTDIDHTLLNEAGELPARNVRALEQARSQGATVVLATARSYVGALPVHRALELDTPLVVSNGTLVVTPTGEVIKHYPMPASAAREAFSLMRRTPHQWSLRVGNVAYVHPDFDRSRAPYNDERHYPPLALTDLPVVTQQFQAVTLLSLFGERLRAFFDQHPWSSWGLSAAFYPPSHFDVREAMSLMSAKASKGVAVRWLRDHLGAGRMPTLALGDSPGDTSMFPLGIGVAPANAAAEVKAVADWIAPHCDDGAVGAALERFIGVSVPEVEVTR